MRRRKRPLDISAEDVDVRNEREREKRRREERKTEGGVGNGECRGKVQMREGGRSWRFLEGREGHGGGIVVIRHRREGRCRRRE
jgi:hypothetical protein